MKSLQEVLKSAIRSAADLFSDSEADNVPCAFDEYCAVHLVKVLTPLMTAIQHHVEVCEPFKHELQVAECDECPTAHVIGTITVDGEALAPFYSRQTQNEIGGQQTSRYHTGE